MLDIPVYIISLDNRSTFDFSSYFTNINYIKAIDTRKKLPIDYLKDNIISWRVYNDIVNGRKDHFAFPGMGGIGLYLSYRKIINKLNELNLKNNVLIFEQDCLINNISEFSRKVNLLNNNKDNFDCAIFGAIYQNIDKIDVSDSISNLSNDFDKCFNYMLNQSIIWSPNGIKRVHNDINKIIDVQLDAFFSNMCLYDNLNLLLEKIKTTQQSIHISTLNNHTVCKLCDTSAKGYNLISVILVILVILVISVITLISKRKCN
jgi:hypothetical protein